MHDRVTVAVNAGGGVDFNGWSENVEAVLMAWHPGQEGGQALAEILTGKVSPSGKLPISIESRWEDNPVHDSYYDHDKRVTYTEGVFVGYRGYDRTGKTPKYPFGYGLSYTDFEYSGLEIRKAGKNVYEENGARVTTSHMNLATPFPTVPPIIRRIPWNGSPPSTRGTSPACLWS